MTPELAAALDSGSPPFHGTTLAMYNLPLRPLWLAYSAAARAIVDRYDPVELVENVDWHWHDGYVLCGGPLSVQDWLAWLDTPQSLRAAWRAEDYVHIGVNPPDLAWYVRFHLWEEWQEHGGFGMDVSGDTKLIDTVLREVKSLGRCVGEVDASKHWFQRHGYTGGWVTNFGKPPSVL